MNSDYCLAVHKGNRNMPDWKDRFTAFTAINVVSDNILKF